MPDVFLSYCHDDRAKAATLAGALKLEALDVWWDAALETGQTYDEKIRGALADSKAVVVLWSPASVKSEWVRAESAVGRERGVLTPVIVRPCNIPVPFNLVHAANLSGWNGDRSHPAYLDLVKQLKTHAGKANVPPLKPPPNRALRQLWHTMAVVAVLAAAGASLWVFRPWEAMRPVDPVVAAKAKRDVSLARLTQFGVAPSDFEQYNWDVIGKKRLKAGSLPELQKLADAGDAPAQALACAGIYWSSEKISEGDQQALKYCRLSAEAGDPVGETYYGYMIANEDPKAAAAMFKKASDQGFGWAQLAYARRLLAGEAVARDPLQAEELMKAVAAKGSAAAEYELGVNTWWGRFGREGDQSAGVRLIQQAADKGDLLAMYDLGQKYRDGTSVPQDLAKARGYFEAVAQASDNPDLASRGANALQDLEKMQAAASEPDLSQQPLSMPAAPSSIPTFAAPN